MAAKQIKELRLSVRTKDSFELLRTFGALHASWLIQRNELFRLIELKGTERTVHYSQQRVAAEFACHKTSEQMFAVLTPVISRALRNKDWEFMMAGNILREQHKRAPMEMQSIRYWPAAKEPNYSPSMAASPIVNTLQVPIYENKSIEDPITVLILEW